MRIKLTSFGLLAASSHNMQPWKIHLDTDPTVFYVFADIQRLSREMDPYARQVMITQGTFLEYVTIGAAFLGYRADIYLFPRGAYDDNDLIESMKIKPVAKVNIFRTNQRCLSFYKYMFLPGTDRGPYSVQELKKSDIEKMLSVNTDKNIEIKIFQDEENKKNIGQYILKGVQIESSIYRIYRESANCFRSNEYKKNKYRYGFSLEGQRIMGLKKHILQGVLTFCPCILNDKKSADIYLTSTQKEVEHTPAYALIITAGNSRSNQVKSGILYSKLVVTAHDLGLGIQPVTQVIEEYPEIKEQYEKIHHEYTTEGHVIQMIFCIGKPIQKSMLSMRRDVMELIDRTHV